MRKGLSLCPFLQLPGSCFLLQRHHAGEFSTCRLELRRSALLGNHTILEYNDFVGIFHRTHTVGNNDNRLACEQAGERLLHHGLVPHI